MSLIGTVKFLACQVSCVTLVMSQLSDGLHFVGSFASAAFCAAVISVAKVYPQGFLFLCFLALSPVSLVLRWTSRTKEKEMSTCGDCLLCFPMVTDLVHRRLLSDSVQEAFHTVVGCFS